MADVLCFSCEVLIGDVYKPLKLSIGFRNFGFARNNAQEACHSLLKDLHWDLHCLVSCSNVFGTGVTMSGTCKEYVC